MITAKDAKERAKIAREKYIGYIRKRLRSNNSFMGVNYE